MKRGHSSQTFSIVVCPWRDTDEDGRNLILQWGAGAAGREQHRTQDMGTSFPQVGAMDFFWNSNHSSLWVMNVFYIKSVHLNANVQVSKSGRSLAAWLLSVPTPPRGQLFPKNLAKSLNSNTHYSCFTNENTDILSLSLSCFFAIGSCYVGQANLKLWSSCLCWDYRHSLPHLAVINWFSQTSGNLSTS